MCLYEKLDRVLANVEWEQKFPLVSIHPMTRTGSDHTHLFTDSRDAANHGNRNQFS
jgi:hypothetical protein